MHKTIEFLINKKNSGERLDVFLSKNINNFTRSYIKKLIEKNNVKLNKIINTSPSTKIKTKAAIGSNPKGTEQDLGGTVAGIGIAFGF